MPSIPFSRPGLSAMKAPHDGPPPGGRPPPRSRLDRSGSRRALDHPGHHHQHTGQRPPRRAGPRVPHAERNHRQGDRRRQRCRARDGGAWRLRRRPGALAGGRATRGRRRAPGRRPGGDAQRLRPRRAGSRPGPRARLHRRDRRHEGDRREWPVRVARRRLRHAQDGARSLEGGRRRPGFPEEAHGDRSGHGSHAARGRPTGRVHARRSGHVAGAPEDARSEARLRRRERAAEPLPRLRRQPGQACRREREAGAGVRRLPGGARDTGHHRQLPQARTRPVTVHSRRRQGVRHAVSQLGEIVLRTIVVSGLATLLAMLAGVPGGYLLARRRFPGRMLLLSAVNTGMGMPPVVVGLVVWLLLVRSGPLGRLDLIYTPQAMVLAQFLIATPLVIGFTAASIQALPPRLPDLLTTLGASRLRKLWIISREAQLGLLAAVMAGFGGVVSEVGASMMVGGNLRDSTRILTTAIVTETGRGHTERALALGVVLLVLAFAANVVLTVVQQARQP